jgi:hypothetical protein
MANRIGIGNVAWLLAITQDRKKSCAQLIAGEHWCQKKL